VGETFGEAVQVCVAEQTGVFVHEGDTVIVQLGETAIVTVTVLVAVNVVVLLAVITTVADAAVPGVEVMEAVLTAVGAGVLETPGVEGLLLAHDAIINELKARIIYIKFLRIFSLRGKVII
jgi:hypothetical protein